MPDKQPANSESASPPSDIDLYCLSCGYNLRGLSGDPRRCPECGEMNPLGDMQLPARLIIEQLRRMETAPTVCLLAVVILVGGLGLLGGLLLAGEDDMFAAAAVLFTIPILSAPVVWVLGMRRFRSSCLARDGWWDVLWSYHMLGLVACGLMVLIALGVAWPVFYVVRFVTGSEDIAEIPALLVLTGAIWFVVLPAGRLVRDRIKQRMDALQRKVAVKLARKHLRERLRHPRRKGIFG